MLKGTEVRVLKCQSVKVLKWKVSSGKCTEVRASFWQLFPHRSAVVVQHNPTTRLILNLNLDLNLIVIIVISVSKVQHNPNSRPKRKKG